MNQSSQRPPGDNGDIALRRAAHDALGGIHLGYALCAEPRCLQQVQRLSWKPPRKRVAGAKQLARRYFPRGEYRHAVMTDVLVRAADAIERRRARGAPAEQQNIGASVAFSSLGTFALFVNGQAGAGDPQRRAKRGRVHDREFALAVGAALIVRRGTSQCLTAHYILVENDAEEDAEEDVAPRKRLLKLKHGCHAKSGPSGYCPRCLNDISLAADRDARRKLIESTMSHSPQLGGNVRARRMSRVARLNSQY